MRIGLLTEGGYPYVDGEARLWCDRLVRGLGQHEFDVYALSRSERQEARGWVELPAQVRRVRSASLWGAGEGLGLGRRVRRRFAECFGELAGVVCAGTDDSGQLADRFGSALYGLAELARESGGLIGALRSEAAVRALESACRAPGAPRAVRAARVPDLLAVAAELERVLRPLSLDWYGDDELGAVDLCHATAGGGAALPGLLAKHFAGVPLLVTEYGVQLRAHYLAGAGAGAGSAGVLGVGAAGAAGVGSGAAGSGARAGGEPGLGAPARALLAAFHGRLATEVYGRATVITPGNAHARRWQERCGADRAKLRTVYPGLPAGRFGEVGEREDAGEPQTLIWVGRVEPAKDLISLLHAFAEVRKEEPKARLRIAGALAEGPEEAAYLDHCRALAAQLFPDEADGAHAVGDNPVSFEEVGGPEVPDLPDAYAAGGVVVLSSVVEGFPISLIEAMLCGRATVSTDVGAVVEVIGGTGLVVPPRNPRALAQACVALLRDPERRARLGAAARARALELFTVEQNIAAFNGIYLEIVSHCPVRREALNEAGEPVPFAHPAEAYVPGRWAARGGTGAGGEPGVSGLSEAGGVSGAPAPTATPAPAPAPSWAAAARQQGGKRPGLGLGLREALS
ncbi:glycosyltransferase [Streptomyces lasiicapitis]|uniref:glycosyltransferase n=1 Tax=Streptomyces lasiicapitis TaxID=1923961 RepID=UPI00364C69A8